MGESGFYLLPGMVHTYAPCGRTPVLRSVYTHDHLSVMSGITIDGRLYTLVRSEALDSLDSVLFLKHLLPHMSDKLLVIWDGSPIHKQFALAMCSRPVHPGKERRKLLVLPLKFSPPSYPPSPTAEITPLLFSGISR
jgi:hypothetical protein